MNMHRLLNVAICGTLALVAIARQKDVVAHIQCAVCKQAVKEASLHAKKNQIDDEEELLDVIENLCSASKDEGKWTAKIDVIPKEAGSRLGLDRRDEEGVCKSECKAVRKACSSALKGREDTLVSEIKDGVGIGKLQKDFCKKQCMKDLPDLKKWNDEAFELAKPAMPDPPKPPPKKDPDPVENFGPLMSEVVFSALQEFGSSITASEMRERFSESSAFEEFLNDTLDATADMMEKELTGMRTGLLKFARAASALAQALQDACPDSAESAIRMKTLAKKLEDDCKDNADAIEYKAMEVLKVDGHDIHKPLNAFLGAWKKETPDAAALGQALANFFKALEVDVKERSDL